MRYLKFLPVLAICLLAVPSAHAQVAVGVAVGPPAAYAAGPPVCPYGYYSFYPYACAPYGYYGPDWFVGGVFIGAGPWYHGFHGYRGYYGRPGFYGRPGYYGRGPVANGFRGGAVARGPVANGFRGGAATNGFRGGAAARGPAAGGFRGGAARAGGFHGGGGHR